MAMSLSMEGCKNQIIHKLREKEYKRAQERRQGLLYLIADYLTKQGYHNSYEALFSEAELSSNICVCDNIDLEIIITEFDNNYLMTFNKYLDFYRKIEADCANRMTIKEKGKSFAGCNRNLQKKANLLSKGSHDFEVKVSSLFPKLDENEVKAMPNKRSTQAKVSECIEKLYPTDSELRKIAKDIAMEIVWNDLNVHWDDVIGLEECKTAIKEAVVYPIRYPMFFSNKFSPWKGILLHGPPGTGKTMLAKAAATECNCTFINVTCSSLVSKWRGESEKYIRVLFDLAYNQSPTIIFIDEIDWISSSSYTIEPSEPARRFRAELLSRLDGLISPKDQNVMLLAATNSAKNLDLALLRRLERHISIKMPCEKSRLDLFKLYVSPSLLTEDRVEYLIKNTDDCSPAQIKLICKTAWMYQSSPLWKGLDENRISISDLKFEITDYDALVQSVNRSQQMEINGIHRN